MKVFVAATAPDEDGEFTFTVPGELCYPTPACDPQHYHPIEVCSCGCTVAWVGLTSRRGTTCATVAEIDATVDQLADVFCDFGAEVNPDEADLLDDPLMRLSAEAFVEQIARAAAAFPLGALLWRDGDTIGTR